LGWIIYNAKNEINIFFKPKQTERSGYKTKNSMEQNKKSRKPVIIISAIAIVIIAIGLFFWIKGKNYETTDNAQLDGNIAMIRSGVTAYLQDIRFTDNQQVKKGDTLMVLNTAELYAKVQQATAALANAKGNLGVSDIRALSSTENATASFQSVSSYKQSITVAKANLTKAQQDFNRSNKLLEIKAVTQQQYEQDKTNLQIAQADYESAISGQQSSVATAQGLQAQAGAEHRQISVAQALVNQREAELALAQEELSHAYVIAPFDGIVTKRAVQQGQYISAGQTLCAVIDTKQLWVTANFKETQLYKIKPGQEVEIQVDAYPGLILKGHVSSFMGATGARFSLLPPDNSTGNFIKITQRFPLRIDIDNFFADKNKPTVLFPGLSVFVKIKTK